MSRCRCERTDALGFFKYGNGKRRTLYRVCAISILEATQNAGALTAATTHYAELKAYALETEGVQNASCEFDIETLRPTYRLIIGTPGKSNAFAISEKLGISSDVIERANALIARENKRFDPHHLT